MPTLNEQAGLSAMLPRIDSRWFDEVLVVDGNSTDGTADEVAKYGHRLIHQKGRGLVDAWNTGFENTSGDIFIVFTPDGNCIPELLPTLIAKISEGYDMVSVSRYLPPAKSHDDTFISALGNHTFTKIINLLFGANHT
ncbi:MAG: glycosyltransferase family 2 protein, partial [Candidatus Binataceae bacterium]